METEVKDTEAGRRFAVMQAAYSRLGAMLATAGKSRDGQAGAARAAVDAEAVEHYMRSGSKTHDVTVLGLTVGTVTVETKDVYSVTDEEAFERWCADNDAWDGYTTVDFDNVDPDRRREAVELIMENWPKAVDVNLGNLGADDFYEATHELRELYPDAFADVRRPPEPDDNWLTWCDGICYDTETGTEVPGVERRKVVAGTKVDGFKWGTEEMGKAQKKKYHSVSTALKASGMPSGRVADMLLGGE